MRHQTTTINVGSGIVLPSQNNVTIADTVYVGDGTNANVNQNGYWDVQQSAWNDSFVRVTVANCSLVDDASGWNRDLTFTGDNGTWALFIGDPSRAAADWFNGLSPANHYAAQGFWQVDTDLTFAGTVSAGDIRTAQATYTVAGNHLDVFATAVDAHTGQETDLLTWASGDVVSIARDLIPGGAASVIVRGHDAIVTLADAAHDQIVALGGASDVANIAAQVGAPIVSHNCGH